MPSQQTTTYPHCGESGAGRFCSGCGAALGVVRCAACGEAAQPGARFCPACGAAFGKSALVPGGAPLAPFARLFGGAAALILVAFVAGHLAGSRGAPEPPTVGLAGGAVAAGGAPAMDLSSMSPEERANRLFNRVMMYSEQGKPDSARAFAPMAIQAYEMLGPVDAHAQYDIGAISLAAGDVPRARAEADTILRARPTHLLGLVLAARAAQVAGDSAAAARFTRRLVAAAPAERATSAKEYADHARDIDDALSRLPGRQ